MPTDNERTITVSITHYNRARMMHISLLNILNDKRVSEIIIMDDGSNSKDFNILKKRLKPYSEKIKLFRRDENQGSFITRVQSVEVASNEWVLNLDSDNTVLPSYLDSIFAEKVWDKNTLYCPGFAYPFLNFKNNPKDDLIDYELASSYAINGTINSTFFNDGNNFFNRDEFVKRTKPLWKCHVRCCSFFSGFLWLSGKGNKYKLLRDAKYIHRIHGGSNWANHSDESKKMEKLLRKCLKENKKADYLKENVKVKDIEWIDPYHVEL